MPHSPRAAKYTDVPHIYSQCSGPGALRTAEFVADKMNLQPNMRVLDIGIYRGIQNCFLANEYGCSMVAVDPWNEFVQYDDECQRNPDGNPRMLKVDAGRWLSFGFVIARKPCTPLKTRSR